MAGSKIEAEFSFGTVKVVIFANPPTGERAATYRTLAISKAYKDEASGEWQYGTSFDVRDTLVLAKLLEQAVDYVMACEQKEASDRRAANRSAWKKRKRKKDGDEDAAELPATATQDDTPPIAEDRPF